MSENDTPREAAQVAPAKFAADLKAQSAEPAHPEASQTADEGMNPIPNAGIPPSGAFDAEGQRPVLERSRKAR